MLRKVDEQNHAECEVVSVEAIDQVLVVKAQVVLFPATYFWNRGIWIDGSMECLWAPRRGCKAPLEETIWPLRIHAGHDASGRLGDLTYQAMPLYRTKNSQWPLISVEH